MTRTAISYVVAVVQPGTFKRVSWDPYPGASAYRIEWDLVPHPTEETAYANNATNPANDTDFDIPVSPGNTYYWRSAALVGGVLQNWIPERSFVT